MQYSKSFLNSITALIYKNNQFIDNNIKDKLDSGNIQDAVELLMNYIYLRPSPVDVYDALRNKNYDILKRYALALEIQGMYLKNIYDLPNDYSSLSSLLLSDMNEPINWSSHII